MWQESILALRRASTSVAFLLLAVHASRLPPAKPSLGYAVGVLVALAGCVIAFGDWIQIVDVTTQASLSRGKVNNLAFFAFMRACLGMLQSTVLAVGQRGEVRVEIEVSPFVSWSKLSLWYLEVGGDWAAAMFKIRQRAYYPVFSLWSLYLVSCSHTTPYDVNSVIGSNGDETR